MLNWLFKKNQNQDLIKRFAEMEASLKTSFTNIKKDMDILFEHTTNFHSKHTKHDEKFKELRNRISELEAILDKKMFLREERNILTEDEDTTHLTDISQKICMILAALNKENPEKLVPLKMLAEEMYPNKKYQGIRSTLSQYTTQLEKQGYIIKKKKGREVYLKSTEKNLYLKKNLKLRRKDKIKN